MKKALLILSLALALTLSGFAQPDRSEAPLPTTVKAPVLPQVVKTRLSNGIEVWTVERHEVPVVGVTYILNSGSAADPPDAYGLANFTASLLDEGAAGKSALEIDDAVDFLGATLTPISTYDYTSVAMKMPSDKLEQGLQILSDVVIRPDFEPDEVDRAKRKLLTTFRQNRDDAGYLASYFFLKDVFPEGHRYNVVGEGEMARVAEFDSQDLSRFHAAHYRPELSTIIVAGDVRSATVTRSLEKTFGGWTVSQSGPERVALPTVPQLNSRRVVVVDKPGAPQTEIRIGWVGVARNTPDFYALEVLNTILGGSFTSRLNQNLREEHGYTYGAGSRFVMRKLPGFFRAQAAVQTDKTGPALKEFFKELNRIAERVPDDELQKAKQYLSYKFPSGFETNMDVSDKLTQILVYSLPADTFDRYVEKIQAVTADQVEAAARKYVDPSKMTVILVGDKKSILPQIEPLELGPVQFRDRMEGIITEE